MIWASRPAEIERLATQFQTPVFSSRMALSCLYKSILDKDPLRCISSKCTEKSYAFGESYLAKSKAFSRLTCIVDPLTKCVQIKNMHVFNRNAIWLEENLAMESLQHEYAALMISSEVAIVFYHPQICLLCIVGIIHGLYLSDTCIAVTICVRVEPIANRYSLIRYLSVACHSSTLPEECAAATYYHKNDLPCVTLPFGYFTTIYFQNRPSSFLHSDRNDNYC